MFTYWLMLAFTAIPAFGGRGVAGRYSRPVAIMFAVVVTLVIGLRYRVGGDWSAYADMYRQISVLNLPEALTFTDPAFGLLNWSAGQLEAGIWLVNLVCATIFTAGLFRFAFSLPNPWLAIVAAVPYLIVVVAMGYTRQSVALGCMMFGLVAIARGSFARFIAWILVGSIFHKTAVLVIPLVVFSYARNRTLTFLLAGILLPVLYYALIAGKIGSLLQTYVDNTYDSKGAAIRVAMNIVPASIYLLNNRRFNLSSSENALWRNISVIALALFPVVLVVSSTTLVDRFALYVMPLQVFIAGWLPSVFNRNKNNNETIVLMVVAYSSLVLFIWLNYAVHSQYWIPYRFLPLEDIIV
ncbi:MAG: EpsG family protein [Sphingomonadaceae bacterium]|nr:EpsG family protein [Sphingomonadaceae bacterium]